MFTLSQDIPLILGHEKTRTSWLEALKGPLDQVVTVYERPSAEWGIQVRLLDKERGEEGKERSERKGMEGKNGQRADVRETRRVTSERGLKRRFLRF